MKKTFEVSKEFILKAYESADSLRKIEIENQFPELFTYKYGDKFTSLWSGNVYILAVVGPNKISAICIESGSRIQNPVNVSNINAITKQEMAEIMMCPNFEQIFVQKHCI